MTRSVRVVRSECTHMMQQYMLGAFRLYSLLDAVGIRFHYFMSRKGSSQGFRSPFKR